MKKEKILNLGCGNTKKEGEIGVDIIKTAVTDVVQLLPNGIFNQFFL